MRYYISDEQLKLREYGRNIQMMVDYARKLKDEKERKALVDEIVRIMGAMVNAPKDNPEYTEKLWQQLYFLGEYDPQIQGKAQMQHMEGRPQKAEKRMDYPETRSTFRQYGKNIERMISSALEMEDQARRKGLINLVANVMKMQLRNVDNNANAELTVMEHIKRLSKGKINLTPDDIEFMKIEYNQNKNNSSKNYKRPGRKKRYRK